jgi:hypothetical protein
MPRPKQYGPSHFERKVVPDLQRSELRYLAAETNSGNRAHKRVVCQAHWCQLLPVRHRMLRASISFWQKAVSVTTLLEYAAMSQSRR